MQILSSLENCKYRFGTTGTLDGNTLNEMTIQGLFGPTYSAITTKELIDQGYASKLKIKCIVLKYPDEVRKASVKQSYHDEVDFLNNHEGRNNFIKNLILSLKGNKLIFFKKNDHGKLLYDLVSEHSKHTFYIDGSVSGEDREKIRLSIEEHDNCNLFASLGTTSTGVSIKKLLHMIAAAGSKSRIRVLQSIGRMLRLHDTKEKAILYDIVDDLSWKSRQNYTLKHFNERVKIYDKQKFDYKIYYVEVK